MVSNIIASVAGSYTIRSLFDLVLALVLVVELVLVVVEGFNKLVKNLLAIVDIRLSDNSLLEISIVS